MSLKGKGLVSKKGQTSKLKGKGLVSKKGQTSKLKGKGLVSKTKDAMHSPPFPTTPRDSMHSHLSPIGRIDIPLKGEDAPPLAIQQGNELLLAVADGMGGRGARKVKYEGVKRSEAYVASRETLNALEEMFLEGLSGDEMSLVLGEALHLETLKSSSSSKLTGRLASSYPTTVTFALVKENLNNYEIQVYWAGDSKAFIFQDNFAHVTKDHDRSSNGGTERLSLSESASFHHTSPLTRFISKKGTDLEKAVFKVPKDSFKGILLSTDGLFDLLDGVPLTPIARILHGAHPFDFSEKQRDDISIAYLKPIESRTNPRRKNSKSSLRAIALAGLAGYLLGKK